MNAVMSSPRLGPGWWRQRGDPTCGVSLHPSIGIIGGMGPWVDPLILQKCLQQQVSLGMLQDQGAAPVILHQYAALINDRTAYLEALECGKCSPNPGIEAAKIGQVMVEDGARVIGVPCNTFHSAPIFSLFEAELRKLLGSQPVKIVNMIEATIDDIVTAVPGIRSVGVISSKGSLRQRVFASPLSARGIDAITLEKGPARISPKVERQR